MARKNAPHSDLPDVLARETVYHGRRISVDRLIVRDGEGREAVREVVRHPGAVVILPITDDGDVVFVRNARVAVGETLLELPAGTLDPGETHADCAARELAEETGYSASRIEPLGRFYASPGVMNEQMFAFVATGLTAGPLKLDAGEQLVPEQAAYAEAIAMCRDGRIRDGKTIAVLLLHQARGEGDGR